MFVPLGTMFDHFVHPQNSSLKCAGGDGLHHLGGKAEICVYRVLEFQVNCEVAPVARPFLSVDVLTSKGVLVVFGVKA